MVSGVHVAEPVDNLPDVPGNVPGMVQGRLPEFPGAVQGMVPAFSGAVQGVGVPSSYGYGVPAAGPYGLNDNTLPFSSADYSTGHVDPTQACTDGYKFTH